MEQHTSPNEEQPQLAALNAPSASKRRCSSNTIDVCAEGARSSVSSEVSLSFFYSTARMASGGLARPSGAGGASVGGAEGAWREGERDREKGLHCAKKEKRVERVGDAEA